MPRVSVALPVYNGENYVGEAVEALLGQTFTDFELVIVDNASTDRTTEICRGFAARDARIRYHRNERNIGGGPNFNLAFEMADRAPYFKWAAHDDIHGPAFLERCVGALDRDPGAVLAFTQAAFIDANRNVIQTRKLGLPLDGPDPVTRFEALLDPYDCLEIFGLMRRDAVNRQPVMGLHHDGDGVLLARLALRGRFVEVPEALFSCRRHPTQATTKFKGDPRTWAQWWDPALVGRRIFPEWRRHGELWRAVLQAPISPRDKARCAVALGRWANLTRSQLFGDAKFHALDLLRSVRPGR